MCLGWMLPLYVGAHTADVTLKDLSGIWVPEPYLKSLETTHSAISAVAEELTISTTSQGQWKLRWHHYHEGSERPILSLSKDQGGASYVLTLGDPPSAPTSNHIHTTTWHVHVITEAGKVKSIEFIDGDVVINKKVSFKRITQPLARHVARKLVVGRFIDGGGHAYIFTPDGKAVWPDSTFPYEVSVDPSQTDCDYFYQPQVGKIESPSAYGFRWKGRTLNLYRLGRTDTMPIHCEEKPFLTLKRSRS